MSICWWCSGNDTSLIRSRCRGCNGFVLQVERGPPPWGRRPSHRIAFHPRWGCRCGSLPNGDQKHVPTRSQALTVHVTVPSCCQCSSMPGPVERSLRDNQPSRSSNHQWSMRGTICLCKPYYGRRVNQSPRCPQTADIPCMS